MFRLYRAIIRPFCKNRSISYKNAWWWLCSAETCRLECAFNNKLDVFDWKKICTLNIFRNTSGWQTLSHLLLHCSSSTTVTLKTFNDFNIAAVEPLLYFSCPGTVNLQVLSTSLFFKVKQSHYRPGQALRVQEAEAPRFQDSRHMEVVKLSALHTGRLYPRKYTWYSFLLEAESTPGP